MLITFIEKHGNYVALAGNNEQMFYHELKDRMLLMAGPLKRMGVKAGDRIGLCGDISTAYVCVVYALIYCGAVVVLLNTRQPASEVQKLANFVQCKMIFVTEGWEKKLTHTHSIDLLYSHKGVTRENVYKTELDQEATILFTSGSSAKPKAVLHTFGNHYHNALGSNENLVLNPGDRWLLSLPLYHVAGLAICIRALLSGATVVFPDNDLPIEKAILKEGITHISLVPTQLYRLLQTEDFKWIKVLKAVLLGGSPIPPALVKKALQCGLPLFTSYGSTEMASQITTSSMHAGYEELITAGYPLPYRKIKINDQGEILVQGATLAKGYIDQKGVCPFSGEDGWFHTGDRGELDKKGRLIVLGRLDNMFISGGENIYPEQIERVICTFTGVEEAVVVPVPDEEFGTRPAAFIRWGNKEEADYQALKEYVRASLAGYEKPVRWFDWPAIETNSKMDRQALIQMARDHSPDSR